MSTQKAKFALFGRLSALGFTYDESAALRRIEMTLQRWAELECGNDRGAIERDEKTGKPRFFYDAQVRTMTGQTAWLRRSYPIADREAGALRRLAAIVRDRNARICGEVADYRDAQQKEILPYHQGDPRGCALYLLTREQLGADAIDSVYTRGLAVCA